MSVWKEARHWRTVDHRLRIDAALQANHVDRLELVSITKVGDLERLLNESLDRTKTPSLLYGGAFVRG